MKRILIIDDEAIVLRSFSKLLTKMGYAPIAAKSGLDAIIKVSRNVFDLILCDLRMPGIDGLDTLLKLKHAWILRNQEIPPVIVMSGDYEHVKDDRIEQIKPVASLIKPFGVDELLKNLELALNEPPKTILVPQFN